MLKFAVTYRKSKYFVDVHRSKTVLELKEIVSGLTGIKSDRFNIQYEESILPDSTPLGQYKRDGIDLSMVNVVITVRVVLNGRSHTYSIGELRLVDDFVRDIQRLARHDGDISLHYNGHSLQGSSTLLANGIHHNAFLTALDGTVLSKMVHPIIIKYRALSHNTTINVSFMATSVKEIATTFTGIHGDNFCLKLNSTILDDSKPISRYITEGNEFTMQNVIINVNVMFKRMAHTFSVNEDSTVDSLVQELCRKVAFEGDLCLFSNRLRLNGADSLAGSGVENNATLKAMNELTATTSEVTPSSGERRMITVEYRTSSYVINIDLARTTKELKEIMSKTTEISPENFSLRIKKILLQDKKPLYKYVNVEDSDETVIEMVNVTIKVFVSMSGKTYCIPALETMKISDFKKEVNRKGGGDVSSLVYNHQPLKDNDTLASSEVQHNASIIAVSRIIGGQTAMLSSIE